MKKIFIYLVIGSTLVFSKTFSQQGEVIILGSSVLGVIDGKSFGVHGEVFGLILQNRREIRKRLYGISTKSGERVGMYEFEGKNYCLSELAEIERSLDESDIARKETLREVLEEAKDDFLGITIDYIESIAGVKDYILLLLEDFFDKKGLERCFLLRWGEAEYGEEEQLIKKEILTFEDFVEFCTDLSDFLEALARSCPKGKKQFIQMVKKAKEAKGAR